MAPGFWVSSLTNILVAQGAGEWVPAAFLIIPLCAIISPLIGGALADQKLSADRLLAWSSILGAVAIVAVFGVLDLGWHPVWFLAFLGVYSLVSGPTWGLLTTISLTHLDDGERRFPLVRVGATFGWVSGGLLASYVLLADTSPMVGYASGVARLIGAGLAFLLPHTPPLGLAMSWSDRFGFRAFSLFRQRDQRVFFVVTALFSVPLSAFYMYGPEFLHVLGDQRPTGTMTVAQVLEVASMLLVGTVMTRYRVKTVLLWALGLSVLRFAMSAGAGVTGVLWWHVMGLALHGVSYTFYFVTAQVFLDRRVDPGLRGQAQGLLGVVTGGLGALAGAAVCGWLRNTCVDGTEGWAWFWGILAGIIGGCFVIFALFYRGLGKEPRVEGRASLSGEVAGESNGTDH